MNLKQLPDKELNTLSHIEYFSHQKEVETKIQELREKTSTTLTHDSDGNSLGIPNRTSRDEIQELKELEKYLDHLIKLKS